ncbi:hypothetical protein GCM10010300_79150 [Streptomyces olivaceoviridis]|nr:hypothetical protein GCM10010300_79150 [Streptomyces olivaceoviridis]
MVFGAALGLRPAAGRCRAAGVSVVIPSGHDETGREAPDPADGFAQERYDDKTPPGGRQGTVLSVCRTAQGPGPPGHTRRLIGEPLADRLLSMGSVGMATKAQNGNRG